MTTTNNTTTIKFLGLSKIEREMHIRKLGHREFFETIHLAGQVIAGAMQVRDGTMTANIFTMLKALPFDTFATICKRVLGGGVLIGVGAIEDPFDCDHFKKYPDELYTATYKAVHALNPELFEKINAGSGKPVTDSAQNKDEEKTKEEKD